MNDVARAWAVAGMDVDTCLDAAVVVSSQWLYTHASPGADPYCNVQAKLRHLCEEEARVKLQLFNVKYILNPQPHAAAVVHALLFWIDQADRHRSAAKRCRLSAALTAVPYFLRTKNCGHEFR